MEHDIAHVSYAAENSNPKDLLLLRVQRGNRNLAFDGHLVRPDSVRAQRALCAAAILARPAELILRTPFLGAEFSPEIAVGTLFFRPAL